MQGRFLAFPVESFESFLSKQNKPDEMPSLAEYLKENLTFEEMMDLLDREEIEGSSHVP